MRKHTITETQAVDQRDLLRAFYVWCFWGEQQHFDKFLQAYAVEKAKIEARRQGHSVAESQLTDGSVKLAINVGG
jgi:hypothetical protein